ncbi:MAG TPA: hypothetical protein VFL65_05970, partial [Jatrophihabitans sp.]|nr:hypothetical protein [Jatrophihabitans sp.]
MADPVGSGRPDDAGLPEGAACVVPDADAWRGLGEVEVGLDPEGVVVDRVRERAYVACSRSNSVAVVDLA